MRIRHITFGLVSGISAVSALALLSSCGGSDAGKNDPTTTTVAPLTKNAALPPNTSAPSPGKGKGKATVNIPSSGG